MTTPKEALEQITNVETSFDKTMLLCQIATMKRIAAEALASLQGEDAVERVARIIDPSAWRDKGYKHAEWRIEQSLIKARAILATGLVPDEAAIRADEREKCCLSIEELFQRNGKSKPDSIWDSIKNRILAAIRSSGRDA